MPDKQDREADYFCRCISLASCASAESKYAFRVRGRMALPKWRQWESIPQNRVHATERIEAHFHRLVRDARVSYRGHRRSPIL